jgi:hypothetical protein
MNRIRIVIPVFIFAFISLTGYSQNYKLSGKVLDKADHQPIPGAFVSLIDLKDTTKRYSTTTDIGGNFILSETKKGSYRFEILSISYTKVSRIIEIVNRTTDLGSFELQLETRVLDEVVIKGQGTAIQKGDTTIMTADAFKVNPDANAEDLLKKMPGITVENGTLKARGEEVKQVLVDGKPFFGDDPSVALKNLPADVIDRVQVYNKLSDQAELTGFDDGESSRTINVVTRKSSRYSKFGKITAGSDFDDKYLAAGNLNVFSGPRRFTITGLANNINQQNFAMQDLIGTTVFQGSRRGFGGRSFGSFSGISKTASTGFNYQDNWGKKIAVAGSYFFNTLSNTKITKSNTEYLLTDEGNLASDSSYAYMQNYNHRVNMRIEYKIDSLNSMIIVPRFSLQDNNSTDQSFGLITGGSVNSQTYSSGRGDAIGYNIGNDLTWRHKFLKKGRTISIRSSLSLDDRKSDNTQLASVDSVPDNQYSDVSTKNFSLNNNLSYTEPIGEFSQLQVNYNNNFRRSKNDKVLFDLGGESEILKRLDSLSSVYDNDYVTNRGGLSYLFRKNKLYFSAGINYEQANLSGTQSFPNQAEVSKTFRKILPNAMINYKFTDISNLRVFYRTFTDAPSITELQNAVDNSNRLRLRTGNPDLKQSYSHNLMSNFSYANPTTGFNTFIHVMANYTTDIIGNRTLYAKNDTLIRPEGFDLTLLPGGQLTYPVNLDHSMRINTIINLSYFLKPIKSNLSFIIGGGYSQSPEYIESLKNRSNAYNLTNSLIITSNINQNVDFTISYTSNYSLVKNSVDLRDNTKYWYQSASAKLNLILIKGFVINTDILGQYNKGLYEGYNDKYLVWNASLGKKFLKNQAAELKIGAYDILDQNKSINRYVTASYIQDTKVNTYRRYFLVIFTYNLRSKNSKGDQPQQQERNEFERHRMFYGPPPGAGPPPERYHHHD